jgi:hypothetical protein
VAVTVRVLRRAEAPVVATIVAVVGWCLLFGATTGRCSVEALVFVLVGPCEVLLCVAWRIDAVED